MKSHSIRAYVEASVLATGKPTLLVTAENGGSDSRFITDMPALDDDARSALIEDGVAVIEFADADDLERMVKRLYAERPAGSCLHFATVAFHMDELGTVEDSTYGD